MSAEHYGKEKSESGRHESLSRVFRQSVVDRIIRIWERCGNRRSSLKWLDQRIIWWFWHMESMDGGRFSKGIHGVGLVGVRRRGRPKRIWSEDVKGQMRVKYKKNWEAIDVVFKCHSLNDEEVSKGVVKAEVFEVSFFDGQSNERDCMWGVISI